MFTEDSSFLDDHKNDKIVNSKEKDLHRVEINKSEVVRNDDWKSKYDTTMKVPFDSTTKKIKSTTMEVIVDSTTETNDLTTQPRAQSTTESVVTTPKDSTSTTAKSTTSTVPIDTTTQNAQNTTVKTPKVVPAEPNSHFIKWFFGKFVVVIFILTFQQKFVTKKIDNKFFYSAFCVRYFVLDYLRGGHFIVRLQILPKSTGFSLSKFVKRE